MDDIRSVQHNKPDDIFFEKKGKRALLIRVGIPNSHNHQECYGAKEQEISGDRNYKI